MKCCSPEELKRKLDVDEDFLLLDVRTPAEHALAHIEPSKLVPLHELEAQLDSLAEWQDQEVVCMCHHGIRSAQACAFLASKGFSRISNLTGGIDAYAVEANPGMPRY